MALDVPRTTSRPLLGVVGVIAVATVVGLAVLWPPPAPRNTDGVLPQYDAVVLDVTVLEDNAPSPTGNDATRVDVLMRIEEGPQAGEQVRSEMTLEGLPPLEVGQQVLTQSAQTDVWFIVDYQRRGPLLLLTGLFVLVVVAASGWQGVRSLVGLAISLWLVVRFIVPAIMAGTAPALVALVGATAVMLLTLYLSHGWSTRSSVAVVGTTAALALTVGLGLWFVDAAAITGFSSEEAVMATFQFEGLSASGLVLAGLIVAALGVLDDVTVAQASTVYALHDTDPQLSQRSLFVRAMAVGRDHIASTVNTLFLAYAGASLALLLLFTSSGQALGDIMTSELVATEVVKTLVGSLGLIMAVPITTWLAAALAVRRSDAEVRWSRAAATDDLHHH